MTIYNNTARIFIKIFSKRVYILNCLRLIDFFLYGYSVCNGPEMALAVSQMAAKEIEDVAYFVQSWREGHKGEKKKEKRQRLLKKSLTVNLPKLSCTESSLVAVSCFQNKNNALDSGKGESLRLGKKVLFLLSAVLLQLQAALPFSSLFIYPISEVKNKHSFVCCTEATNRKP